MNKFSILRGIKNSNIHNQNNKNIIKRLLYCCNSKPDLEIFRGEDNFTYRKFIKEVNNFAAYLQAMNDFKKENPVVLALDSRINRYVALYGVLASGGYYLPIEPEKSNYVRIIDIINSSGCNIAFITSEINNLIKDKINDDVKLICIDNVNYDETKKNCIIDNFSSDNPAYMIYTSGSTGVPRGVIVPHKAIINMILSLEKKLDLDVNDIGISFTSFSFDSCGCDIYTFILNMIPIVTINNRNRYIQDLEKLNNLCIENKVTILFLPTVLAEKFVGLKNDYLKILYFGGEKFCKNVKTTYKLCNSYGLTETGILNTFYEVKGNEEDIPLGAPIYNTDIVIIDEEEKIVDIGVVGEIVVLGESLAIGYKNDLRKTQDKFICLQGMENSRGYKTGDIGYIGTDFNLYYKGRKDKQVKISGYRIELGEIKFKSQKIPGIEISIPMVIKDENRDILVNFFVSKLEYSDKQIRMELEKTLPFYMIPMYNIKINEIPYTINGKINYSILEDKYRDMRTSIIKNKFITEEDLMKYILDYVSDILCIDKRKINRKSNFFELGGDSLKALKLKLNIKDFLGIDIEFTNIYDDFTLEKIVNLIRGDKND